MFVIHPEHKQYVADKFVVFLQYMLGDAKAYIEGSLSSITVQCGYEPEKNSYTPWMADMVI